MIGRRDQLHSSLCASRSPPHPLPPPPSPRRCHEVDQNLGHFNFAEWRSAWMLSVRFALTSACVNGLAAEIMMSRRCYWRFSLASAMEFEVKANCLDFWVSSRDAAEILGCFGFPLLSFALFCCPPSFSALLCSSLWWLCITRLSTSPMEVCTIRRIFGVGLCAG